MGGLILNSTEKQLDLLTNSYLEYDPGNDVTEVYQIKMLPLSQTSIAFFEIHAESEEINYYFWKNKHWI